MIKVEGHSLLIGPPGTGRTTWARKQAAKPITTDRDALQRMQGEQSYTYRVAGLPVGNTDVLPFRAPHFTVSALSLTGRLRDGWRWTPGEVSLAHGGTLFLDEIQEFPRALLDAIRPIFERQSVAYYSSVAKTPWPLSVPCVFRLIVAGHPCPCGFRGSTARECKCSPESVERYAMRVPAWIRKACEVVPIERYSVVGA